MNKIRFLITLILVVALGAVVGLTASPAKQVLHLYTALDVDQAKVYIEAFEATHPEIDVEWVRLSSGEVLARIRAEAANPQASIWIGGPSTSHIAAAEDGLLEPYCESLAWQYISDEFKDPDCLWIGIYTGFIGFVSNTEFLEGQNVQAPASWQDLLKPEFKGEISMAYPYTSGTAYTVLATIVFLYGGDEDEAFDYAKKLDEQMHHYTKSGTACITEAGLGEVAVGIAFSHDIVKKGIAAGYPVAMTFPEEGTGYEIGGMSLIKDGPKLELARVFYDWMASAEAQTLYKEFYRVPLNPEAELGEGVVSAADVNLIAGFDPVWAGGNKDRLTERWREVTGK